MAVVKFIISYFLAYDTRIKTIACTVSGWACRSLIVRWWIGFVFNCKKHYYKLWGTWRSRRVIMIYFLSYVVCSWKYHPLQFYDISTFGIIATT
jgi:hypothetical protein